MATKIGIFYFSGTGNTEFVARKLHEGFMERGCESKCLRMEDILNNGTVPEIDRYDIVGIGHPVIGYGTPRIALRFAKALPEGGGKRVFLFKTAGGVDPINYNASRPLARALRKRGYRISYDRIFSLNSNWIVTFDPPIANRLVAATCRKCGLSCEEILAGKERVLATGPGLRTAMGIVRGLSHAMMRFVGKDMRAVAACDLCRKCVRICPVGNIREKKGRIRFGASCEACMRCVYACPKDAIRYRAFSFFKVPGGYDVRKTIAASADGSAGDSGYIPPFFPKYVGDDEL